MKNIWKIFSGDVKGLIKNKLALTIAIGICVLPSLYAWFNIYSNWNPYGNTSSIKVAVTSLDEGYTKNDGDVIIMGDAVLDNLRENDKIGWTFVDTKEEAIDGVESGEYYAAIVIGDDFSESMYGFADNNLKHPSVTYYENEKKNAVASKITDTAKGTLQTSINEEFVNVAVSTVMESMNELADDAEKSQYIQSLMDKLQSVNDNLDDYLVTIDGMIACNSTLASNLSTASSQVTSATGKISSGVNQVNQAKAQAQADITNLTTQLDTVYQNLNTQLQNASTELNQGGAAAGSGVTGNAGDYLQQANQSLDTLKNILNSGAVPEGTTKTDITNVINSVQTTTNAVSTAISTGSSDNATLAAAAQLMNAIMPIVEKQLQEDITSIKNDITSAYNSMISSLNSMNKGLAGTGVALGSLSNTVSSSNGSFSSLKDIIASTQEKVETLISELQEVSDGERYDQLIRILSSDPENIGAFFAEPVTVNTVRVYEVENYGSSVTPFYTILALWVGAVILVAIIKVQVENEKFETARPYQKYFGRFLMFFVLGQLQAVIVVLGDLYLLKVQCLEPGLFFLVASFTSFTFNLLIYTLTVSFGDVGKALVVVVMVIQIAGSSGTYPIEILPEFYQNIYVYFPFPYAINAMRETIGGMYQNDYWTFMSQLSIFAIIALLIGLFIRKPFMKMNHFVEKRMEDTKMM